jgi:hypothetical protein
MDEEVSRGLAERFGLGGWFSMKAAVPPVFQMLCGLSLELLYKALIVSQSKALPKPPTHALKQLATTAGVPVSKKDAKLLDVLTEVVSWAGRYPLPNRRHHVARFTALRSDALYDRKPLGKRYVLTPNGALSWNGFDRLWRQGAELYKHPEMP